MLGVIEWNPDRVLFTVPILNRPVVWYGLFFAVGFLLGFYLFRFILRRYFAQHKKTQKAADKLADRLLLYMVIGTVVGARIGHLLFYEHFSFYLTNPLDIIKVWDGGLASHGGAVGILLALWIFCLRNKSKISYLRWLDLIAIPTSVIGACIRFGNFFGQEIIGRETSMPWGVIFGNPLAGESLVPRHPVQLYEALSLLAVGIVLFVIYLKRGVGKVGRFIGAFLTWVFLMRFVLEYFKMPQSDLIKGASLFSMGQILSVPFIILGIYLISRPSQGA